MFWVKNIENIDVSIHRCFDTSITQSDIIRFSKGIGAVARATSEEKTKEIM